MATRPRLAAAEPGSAIGWAEIGRFAEALTFARRELFAPVQGIRQRYGLGPRGIWIIGLIASGRVCFQSDIAKLWRIGRSMVTEEIAALTRAGLVTTGADTDDRRQIRLELTARGHKLNAELGDAFSSLLRERLASYRPEDIEACIRLLRDLAGLGATSEFTGP